MALAWSLWWGCATLCRGAGWGYFVLLQAVGMAPQGFMKKAKTLAA